MRRHAELTSRGILVLHFTPSQIRKEPGRVLAAVTSALAAGPSRARQAIRSVPAAS
jgi:very-short-patch-repair endonuclease